MSAEQLFSTLNLITIVAWLTMICLPRVRWTSTVVPVASSVRVIPKFPAAGWPTAL